MIYASMSHADIIIIILPTYMILILRIIAAMPLMTLLLMFVFMSVMPLSAKIRHYYFRYALLLRRAYMLLLLLYDVNIIFHDITWHYYASMPLRFIIYADADITYIMPFAIFSRHMRHTHYYAHTLLPTFSYAITLLRRQRRALYAIRCRLMPLRRHAFDATPPLYFRAFRFAATYIGRAITPSACAITMTFIYAEHYCRATILIFSIRHYAIMSALLLLLPLLRYWCHIYVIFSLCRHSHNITRHYFVLMLQPLLLIARALLLFDIITEHYAIIIFYYAVILFFIYYYMPLYATLAYSITGAAYAADMTRHAICHASAIITPYAIILRVYAITRTWMPRHAIFSRFHYWYVITCFRRASLATCH